MAGELPGQGKKNQVILSEERLWQREKNQSKIKRSAAWAEKKGFFHFYKFRAVWQRKKFSLQSVNCFDR